MLSEPMPIPTLPQYVTLSNTLSSQFSINELSSVYSNSDFLRKWGNLLTLGTVHLSPRGTLVDEFLQYLENVHNIQNVSSAGFEEKSNATHVLIRNHDDADISIDFIMSNLNERTFVAIHFDEDNDDVSFEIFRPVFQTINDNISD